VVDWPTSFTRASHIQLLANTFSDLCKHSRIFILLGMSGSVIAILIDFTPHPAPFVLFFFSPHFFFLFNL